MLRNRHDRTALGRVVVLDGWSNVDIEGIVRGAQLQGSKNVVASKVHATLEAGMFDEEALSTLAPLGAAVASAGERESQACRHHDAPPGDVRRGFRGQREPSNRRSAQHHPLADTAACVARLQNEPGPIPLLGPGSFDSLQANVSL